MNAVASKLSSLGYRPAVAQRIANEAPAVADRILRASQTPENAAAPAGSPGMTPFLPTQDGRPVTVYRGAPVPTDTYRTELPPNELTYVDLGEKVPQLYAAGLFSHGAVADAPGVLIEAQVPDFALWKEASNPFPVVPGGALGADFSPFIARAAEVLPVHLSEEQVATMAPEAVTAMIDDVGTRAIQWDEGIRQRLD